MQCHRWILPALLAAACTGNAADQTAKADPVAPAKAFEIKAGKPVESLPNERHLKNVRMLTFDGQNAEAYWSNDGTKLILQRRANDEPADQIYTIDLQTGEQKLVSTGTGRTTCSYFLQGDERIIFASTHHHGDAPPVVKATGGGYVWSVHREYDLFTANADGSDLQQLTDTPGYDAEATVCPITGDIVFTSVRDGDLELYTMAPDGSDLKRITDRPGYDGGAFFSHDGTKIVQRSAYPKDEEEARANAELLGQQLVRPSRMEITVCDRDGSNFRQITKNGAANFGPFWLPDNERIIFVSNFLGLKKMRETGDHTAARNFEIFLVSEKGGEPEQVTFNETFDGFPMFSPDGKYLAFASNRYNTTEGDTNIFIAEWVE